MTNHPLEYTEEEFDPEKLVNLNPEEISDFKISSTITPETAKPSVPAVIEKTDDKSYDLDFDYIRANLKSLIENGSFSLERMIQIARESESPRAFEVVATLMKAVSDANKDLLSIHEKRDSRVKPAPQGGDTTNIQNNLFVGSTSELARLLNKRG